MAATFQHFAINADDVQHAKRFYEGVFGWRFNPWGPPNFYQMKNAGSGLLGAAGAAGTCPRRADGRVRG